jgi:hypothetical protein
MSSTNQLSVRGHQLLVKDGTLCTSCCAAPCQWRVLWTYQCGECVAGVYAGKGYVAGTPEKITADFQTPGDYPNEDNTLVMRYGASPAEACDTPAEGDLDTTTQPALAPTNHPCRVFYDCTYLGDHFSVELGDDEDPPADPPYTLDGPCTPGCPP